jgi:hypothetical protein
MSSTSTVMGSDERELAMTRYLDLKAGSFALGQGLRSIFMLSADNN